MRTVFGRYRRLEALRILYVYQQLSSLAAIAELSRNSFKGLGFTQALASRGLKHHPVVAMLPWSHGARQASRIMEEAGRALRMSSCMSCFMFSFKMQLSPCGNSPISSQDFLTTSTQIWRILGNTPRLSKVEHERRNDMPVTQKLAGAIGILQSKGLTSKG